MNKKRIIIFVLSVFSICLTIFGIFKFVSPKFNSKINNIKITTNKKIDEEKKKKIKRTIKSILIDIVLCISVIVVLVFFIKERFFASGKYTPLSDFVYSIENDAITLVQYTGTKNNVDIAPTYKVSEVVYNTSGIAKNCFKDSNVEIVALPDTITFIDESAFENSKISEIFIPENVKKIESYAFASCNNLKTVYFNAVNCNEINIDGNLFNNNVIDSFIITENVLEIPSYLFASSHSYDCVSIKEIIFDNPNIKKIGDYAFKNTNIKDFTIPESVSVIGNGIFQNSLIENITLNSKIEFIPDYAFYNCSNLQQIFVPDNIKILGVRCFNSTSLLSINLPGTLTVINESVFENTKLKIINFDGSKEDWENVAIHKNSILSNVKINIKN